MRRKGFATFLAAETVLAGTIVYLHDHRDPDMQVFCGTLAVAVPLSMWSSSYNYRARRALSRAIWWYNRDLPR